MPGEAPAAGPGPLESRIEARDREARARAVDPRFNVALEASAGTGKTRVLVDRYVNLLREGVDPANILAITFTRKAAAEMRERILATLQAAAARGEIPPSRWRDLRDRTGDIAISTIDAFCLGLLREFPLEADLDPGFSVADDTEVPRLIDESLDRALRACRAAARDDEDVALVFAQLGDRRVRAGLAALLNRRDTAPAALVRHLARAPRDLTVAEAARRGARRLTDVFGGMRGGCERFLETGPLEPAFQVLAWRLRRLQAEAAGPAPPDAAAVHAAVASLLEHFLTQDRTPRTRLASPRAAFASPSHWRAHRDLVIAHAPAVAAAAAAFRRDLNLLVARGVWRMYRIAEAEYQRTLRARTVLDFPELLLRALDLLRQMEEFAQSRYRLESRYHHVLVDEFQDTSRAQWELVSLLVRSWGEGAGLAHEGPLQPSIFIVGDRKQSIYGFRGADVAVLRDASRFLASIRREGDVRRSISRSFRSVPALLAFVNDVFDDMEKVAGRPDAFEYTEEDRFPPARAADAAGAALGIVAGDTPEACAGAAASAIAALIDGGAIVRDRETGVARPARAGDVAILFRTRNSHREFEAALERRGIPSYVYQGLGFFDADEIRDVLALLGYLADPMSELRAAAWLRSRFVRLSDEGLRRLAPSLAAALAAPAPPRAAALDAEDVRALDLARAASARWRALADRMPPAELLDLALAESAYAAELRGPRFVQARENLKKVRALVRRLQNRGYATIGRVAAHLDRLAAGDEANAVVDASDAVNLMTIHAAKGLEFPIVFLVDLSRGTARRRDPVRVAGPDADEPVAVGDFLSAADEDEEVREREETKRLLYVALTRARDRLYLGSVLSEGRLRPGRGSLAEVLPVSLSNVFAAAAGSRVVRWRAASGTEHAFEVCPVEAGDRPGSEPAAEARASIGADVPPADFAPLAVPDAGRRTTVSELFARQGEAPVESGTPSDQLVGTLVHRLLQRVGIRPAAGEDELAVALGDAAAAAGPAYPAPAELLPRVLETYRAFCAQTDLVDAYQAGEPFHEVPFSVAIDGTIVRGTIDCLVRAPDGGILVIEFKTGRRRPEHAAQVDLYRIAAESVFPGCRVEARVLYAGVTTMS